MSRHMLLIINPLAGRRTARNQLFAQIDALTRAGWRVSVHPTQCAEDATRVVREMEDDYEMIVCSGGDGTLCEVVTGLMLRVTDHPDCENPPLGYIPAGTTNDFAASLQLPSKTDEAIAALLTGQPRGMDVGLFCNRQYFTYSAAFGLMTEVCYTTPQDQKNLWGRMAYIMEGIRRIPDIRSHHLRIIAGSQQFEDDYSFGVISNATSVAGMIHFDPETVRYDDGYFEVLLVRDPGSATALARIMLEIMSQTYDEEYVRFFRCSELIIESGEPVCWCLDGEEGGEHRHVEIRNIRQGYRLILRSEVETALLSGDTADSPD